MNIQEPIHPRTLVIFSVIAIFVGLLATLKSFYTINGFWEDEFFQIAFINESYRNFVFSIARLDVHPPFHYFQLKLWGELFSSDKGLLLNSVVWHLISTLAIFLVCRAWKGATTGVLASAIYVLIPQVVWASVTLRPYSFLPGLAVLAWWLNIRTLSTASPNHWKLILLAIVELVLGYSHAVAFYFVFWISLAASAQVYYEDRSIVSPWRKWLLTQILVGLLLLPLVFIAFMRTGVPGNSAPAGSFLLFIGALVSGWGMKSLLGLGLGTALYVAALILGLNNRATRPITIFILAAPLSLAFLITTFVAPMLKAPVYSSILIPFVAVALANSLVNLRRNRCLLLTAPLLFVLMISVFPASEQLLRFRTTNPWEEVAREVKQRATKGDIVVVAKPFSYWAVLRYAVGPHWGAPSEILPPLNDRWLGLVQRIGPRLTEFLHLIPKTDHLVHDGITYAINDDISLFNHTAKHIWVIHTLPYAEPVRGADDYIDKGIIWRGGQRIELRLMEKEMRPMTPSGS